MFGKIISGFIGGLMMAIFAGIIASIALHTNPDEGAAVAGFISFGFFALGFVLAVTASRAGKAWRRIFAMLAILSFCLPLSSFIATTIRVTDAAADSNAIATGSEAVAGGIITAVSGFLGFFLGVIFLIVCLLTGRDKEVIVIKEKSAEG